MGLSDWNWLVIICVAIIILMLICPSFCAMLTMGNEIAKCVILAVLIGLILLGVMMDPSLIENLFDTADDIAKGALAWAEKGLTIIAQTGGSFLSSIWPVILIGAGALILIFRNPVVIKKED